MEPTAVSSRSRSWLMTISVAGSAPDGPAARACLRDRDSWSARRAAAVGLGEQSCGERDAHAPAAGKFRAWPLLVGGGETKSGEDRCRAGRGRVRADIGEPGLDLGDAMRVLRGLRFRQQRRALAMRLQHDLEQAVRPVRGFLRQPSDAPARRDLDVALLGREIAGDDAEQGGLAGAVAADQADPRAGGNARGGAFQQLAAGNADSEIVNNEHAAPFDRRRGARQPCRRFYRK